jgi:hypothetical protein
MNMGDSSLILSSHAGIYQIKKTLMADGSKEDRRVLNSIDDESTKY